MRLVLLVLGLLLLGAPASAHDTGHAPPDQIGNLRTVVTGGDLPAGLTLDVLENGRQLRLRNSAGRDAVVLADKGAPRFRLGPGGAFVNSALPDEETPHGDHGPEHTGDTAEHPVQWRQLSTEPVISWHDHTAHWGDANPPAIADPSARSVIRPWTVRVLLDGEKHEARGELQWVPGPSPWPWAAVALVVAAAGAWLLRARDRALGFSLGVVALLSAVHGLGLLAGRDAEPTGRGAIFLAEYLPALAGWLLAGAAGWLLVTGKRDGRWFALLGAGAVGVFTVARDLVVLSSSTSVSVIPLWIDRGLVTLAAGLATAGVIAVLWQPKVGNSSPQEDPIQGKMTL
ncbi:hypothetical protein D5S17_11950 [Pseudonocardiaceae bacterium YIM PH 21723]|nr:hypothetical protein D5S17_11950 [Pseudonocardiaceae bacterium YIM PH 21723]